MDRSAAIALYEAVVATNPKVTRKGATIPYTSVNGHMLSMLTKDGKVALKLPPDERAAFLSRYKTTLCEQYGIVQREFVIVPDSLLAKTQELKRHFDVGYAWVATLKPKPTTRSKKAGAKAAVTKPRASAAQKTSRSRRSR
jgi:hypothetical protein